MRGFLLFSLFTYFTLLYVTICSLLLDALKRTNQTKIPILTILNLQQFSSLQTYTPPNSSQKNSQDDGKGSVSGNILSPHP